MEGALSRLSHVDNSISICTSTLQHISKGKGLVMSNKNSDPSNKETKAMSNEETTDHSKTMAFASCAIACLAALSQGNLLTWLNPVLPQVDFRFDN